jgi:hypothetical protein
VLLWQAAHHSSNPTALTPTAAVLLISDAVVAVCTVCTNKRLNPLLTVQLPTAMLHGPNALLNHTSPTNESGAKPTPGNDCYCCCVGANAPILTVYVGG